MNEQIVERMAKAAREAWPTTDLNIEWEELREGTRNGWRAVARASLDATRPSFVDEYVRGLEATVSRLTAERVTRKVNRAAIRPIIAKAMRKVGNPEVVRYNQILNDAVEDIFRLLNDKKDQKCPTCGAPLREWFTHVHRQGD